MSNQNAIKELKAERFDEVISICRELRLALNEAHDQFCYYLDAPRPLRSWERDDAKALIAKWGELIWKARDTVG